MDGWTIVWVAKALSCFSQITKEEILPNVFCNQNSKQNIILFWTKFHCFLKEEDDIYESSCQNKNTFYLHNAQNVWTDEQLSVFLGQNFASCWPPGNWLKGDGVHNEV